MSDIISGFDPVFDENSKVLILGSFPSVKSRQVSFYYGNKQNRFWKILSEFFEENIAESAEEKKRFVLSKGIALWDIVTECEIVGSSDSSIKNYTVADLDTVLKIVQIKQIFLNGKKAYQIFSENYKDIDVPFCLLPSTSPANPRFCKEDWLHALAQIFSPER